MIVALALYAAASLISMAVMSIGAALAGVAILVAAGGPKGMGRELKSIWSESLFRRYVWASLALVSACALSLLVAKIAPLGWNGHFVEPHLEDLAKFWYFAWPLILLIGLRKLDESGRKCVLRSWIITLAVLSVVGVIQHFSGWPKPQFIPSSPNRYHATLFLGHHLSVASILIFPFFAALDFLKEGGRGRKLLPSWFLVATAFLGFTTLFLTYSRTLWVALPIGAVVWALRGLSRKQVAALFVAGMIGLGIASQVPGIRSRALDTMGIGERQKLWLANIEFLRLRPLTGAGFRRNIDASAYYLESLPGHGDVFSSHAHNDFIDMLGGTGLLGALAWLAWCWVTLKILWRGFKNPVSQSFAWGLLCAWLVFQINGLTQVNFWEGKVMHQMMWVVAWSLLWVVQKPEDAQV